MNVTKCINGHFFDADKYQLCPHCGAMAITGSTDVPSPETKKSHISFWGKKKQEDTDGDVIQMPDKTIGKTFGVFGDKVEDSADDKKEDKERVVSGFGGIVMCDRCGQTYNALSNMSCPHCKPVDVSKEIEKSSKSPSNNELKKDGIQHLESKNNAPVITTEDDKESLHAAVQKAVSGSEGKTVGFFSASVGAVSVNSEPVVGWLVCIKGKHFGESFNIGAGRNAIGRSDTNKIIFAKDESVSRNKHAWITYEPKKREFFIQPGESSGLSYLNGDNIMESKKLQANDVLEFGNGQYMLIPLCGENFTWEDYINKE